MEKRNASRKGFLLGKFMPLHAGHVHLIHSALSRTEELWILVCSIQREPIPGNLRYEWVKQSFPSAHVIHLTEEVPQAPEESPDFWNIWLDIFKRYLPQDIDTVFSSESYGDEIASRLKIRHELIDKERKKFPVSGTQVRDKPFKNWQFIPEIVRPYFVKKIVLTGPESTGKTELARKLAGYYQTSLAYEYARVFWPRLKNRRLEYDDISVIAKGQLKVEEEAVRQANKILICDTDLMATQIWSEMYFNKSPDWIVQLNQQRRYDLYLLMDIDIPWVDDGSREFPHRREYHFNLLVSELKRRGLKYKIISGDFNERFDSAVMEIDTILAGGI